MSDTDDTLSPFDQCKVIALSQMKEIETLKIKLMYAKHALVLTVAAIQPMAGQIICPKDNIFSLLLCEVDEALTKINEGE